MDLTKEKEAVRKAREAWNNNFHSTAPEEHEAHFLGFLRQLQNRLAAWQGKNFGAQEPYIMAMGMCEEVGELAEAYTCLHEPCCWVTIPDFTNYEVSCHGTIRRSAPGSGNTKQWQERRPTLRPDGYLQVLLTKGTEDTKQSVLNHHAVAAAFLGPRPDGMEINHRDGDKLHNAVWNLEYLTRSDNMQHAVSIGLHRQKRKERAQRALLTNIEVEAIRTRSMAGESVRELAAEFMVSRRTIQFVVSGRTWVDPPIEHEQAIEMQQAMIRMEAQVGKVQHYVLKHIQRIRGMDQVETFRAAAGDAIADVFIYLVNFLTALRIDAGTLFVETAERVMARDWTKNTKNGGE